MTTPLQATQLVLENRFGRVGGSPARVSAVGPTTLYTPTTGKCLRLKWLALATPETNTIPVVATVRIGGLAVYIWPLGSPGAFAHSSVREGTVNGLLTIELTANDQDVYVNMDVEEFPPQ